MLRQAAAVLISLPALLASKFSPVALLALLGERLAVTRASDAALGKFVRSLIARGVLVVINGTTAGFLLQICLIGEARWRGWEAPNQT